ncbi:MAG: glycogen debranching enzyme family protein [Phycisphaerales bacterium]|nr:glycogen debranching enzyme family protein [Phycisphaerales bacterium]
MKSETKIKLTDPSDGSCSDARSEISSAQWDPAQTEGFEPSAEWVLGAGNGSFAMGSIDSTPRRRYHGLLIASQSPPVVRVNQIAAMDECVHIQQEHCCTPELEIHLTRFRFSDDQSPPETMPGLVGFSSSYEHAEWTYHIPTQNGAISIRKTLTLGDRINASLLTYEIQSPVDASMTLKPLLAMRDFHELNHTGSISTTDFETTELTEPGVSGVRVDRGSLRVQLRGLHLDWSTDPTIFERVVLDHETRRGQPDTEDWYAPGNWSVPISKGVIQTIQIELADRDIGAIDWNATSGSRQSRVQESIEHVLSAAGQPDDPEIRSAITKLAAASDAYIVDRDESTSIIAGYPWFSDWGRDTMISLPGLLLVTGRTREALDALSIFAQSQKHGLIPNRFDDDAGEAHFNTVDASLWFVHACERWCHATGSKLPEHLDHACFDVINAYTQGTIHNIGVDPSDGLVCAGSETTQLTWMDAQRDGVTFTPRHGKPIEIQALWINALRAYASMINPDRPTEADAYRSQADLAQSSLESLMTNGPSGGLVDCLIPKNHSRSLHWERSEELRPNQIFALSLPHVQLPIAIRDDSIRAVWDALLTPIGIRTLSPDDPEYRSRYTGTLMDRDAAYHNGTVWPWLLGPACEALMRTRGFDDVSRATSIQRLTRLASVMSSDSVGQIHEIYDAEPSDSGHRPDGCPAQAWSIAETLRVLILACNPDSELPAQG